MKIFLNNSEEFFEPEDLTVSRILELKQFKTKLMMVKVNGNLVKKADWNKFNIRHGDDVHIVMITNGG